MYFQLSGWKGCIYELVSGFAHWFYNIVKFDAAEKDDFNVRECLQIQALIGVSKFGSWFKTTFIDSNHSQDPASETAKTLKCWSKHATTTIFTTTTIFSINWMSSQLWFYFFVWTSIYIYMTMPSSYLHNSIFSNSRELSVESTWCDNSSVII